MTTFVNFSPSPTTPFQFQATLDGTNYQIVITWSLFGQRWYLNVYTVQNVLVIATAMVGSPANYDINLVAGVFQTSTLVYRIQNNQFEINP